MFLQFGNQLGNDLIMMCLESLQFGEPRYKKPFNRRGGDGDFSQLVFKGNLGHVDDRRLTVHGVFLIGQQLRQGPEGVLLVHVHEQQGGDLTHPLTVAHLLDTAGQETRRRVRATATCPRPVFVVGFQLKTVPEHLLCCRLSTQTGRGTETAACRDDSGSTTPKTSACSSQTTRLNLVPQMFRLLHVVLF